MGEGDIQMITIPYRGKNFNVDFIPSDSSRDKISFGFKSSKFEVQMPVNISISSVSYQLKEQLQCWMIEKCQFFVRELLERICPYVNVYTYQFEIVDIEEDWGDIGRYGSLRLDWRLAFLGNEYLEAIIKLQLLRLKHRGREDFALEELKEKHYREYGNHQWLQENEQYVKSTMNQIEKQIQEELLPFQPVMAKKFVIRDAITGDFQSKQGPVNDIIQADWYDELNESIIEAESYQKMMNILEIKIQTGRIIHQVKR